MDTNAPSVRAVFEQALELESTSARAAYLVEACAAHPGLRADVEALLLAHANAGSFLASPLVDCRATTLKQQLAEEPGTVIGHYKLLQQIGEGGMGVVFMADQSQPIQRTVALKIIKPGMDTRQVIARFDAERQALAMMDHPNIARVIDAGATASGRPFFAMELVKGVPITQYCDERLLPVRARLELFTDVCQAVQHAHQKGVIHRDIKPTNVLVAEYDSRPVPKVIDFGVAKATAARLTQQTMFTEFGQVVGTMEYMSPEQAKLNQLDVDTRSDVYALGVLLYVLLTGSTPFGQQRLQEAAFDEMLRIIREEEPPKPSTRLSSSAALPSIAAERASEPLKLSRQIRGELDWIVMKALEKDRTRRYASANELALDIDRYLASEPVEAVPPSAAYRLRKLASRHKAVIAGAAVVAAALVLGTTLSIRQAALARRSETLAQNLLESEQQARRRAIADAAKATAISEVLQQMLGLANPSAAKGSNYSVRQMLDDFAGDLGDRLQDQPEAEAAIHATIGNAFRGLQAFDKAEPHLKAALELRLRLHGREHAEVANSLVDYSANLFGRGDVDEAEAQAREAWAIHQRMELPDETSIRVLSALQFYLVARSQFGEAEQVAQQALEIARRHPHQFPEEAIVLHSLAQAAAHQGNPAKAEQFARQSVAIHQSRHGAIHPETAHGMYILARSLHDQQKYDEAETYFRRALAIHREHYEDYQTPIMAAAAGLADTLRANRDQAGLDALRTDIDLSDTSPNEWESWYFRGSYCAAIGDWEQAAIAFDKAAERETDPEQLRYLYYVSLVRLAGDDLTEYRETCKRLVYRAKQLKSRRAALLATWVRLLAPEAVADPGELLAPTLRDYEGRDPDLLSTLGAVLYRNNQFNDAISKLGEAIEATPVDANELRAVTYSQLFLSMAHSRLGHINAAQEYFDRAVRSLDQPASPSEKMLTDSWHIALPLRLLRSEAEELLSGKAQD